MSKVTVTIDDGRTKRTYEDEYAFVCMLHEMAGSPEGRWLQEPQGWKDGLGLFFAGIEAFRVIAEQDGDEAFKCAARAALKTLERMRPNGDQNE